MRPFIPYTSVRQRDVREYVTVFHRTGTRDRWYLYLSRPLRETLADATRIAYTLDEQNGAVWFWPSEDQRSSFTLSRQNPRDPDRGGYTVHLPRPLGELMGAGHHYVERRRGGWVITTKKEP
jgi:hypothetical protein